MLDSESNRPTYRLDSLDGLAYCYLQSSLTALETHTLQPDLKWIKEKTPATIGTGVPLLVMGLAPGRVTVRENGEDFTRQHLLPGNIDVYKP